MLCASQDKKTEINLFVASLRYVIRYYTYVVNKHLKRIKSPLDNLNN